jgi:hypothetical protein
MYEEEVKSCFFDLSDKKQIDIQVDHHLTYDDSIKSIFRYYKEQHCRDWKSMMRETSPIFLSPAILNKFWMIQVRKIAEEKLQLHSKRLGV